MYGGPATAVRQCRLHQIHFSNNYSQLSAAHISTPVAIERAGTWHHHGS